MNVKNESEVAQLCPTLRDPMDYSLPGSSIHGIFQARVLEWGAIAFSDGTTSGAQSFWSQDPSVVLEAPKELLFTWGLSIDSYMGYTYWHLSTYLLRN